MGEKVDVDLVGVADIARRVGLSNEGVSRWVKDYEDFPEPAFELVRRHGVVRFWDWEEVDAWRVGRGLGR